MGKLDAKVAIITGGARGMGRATAELFALQGARVVICDMLDEEGSATAAAIGASALYRRLDVSDEKGWEALAGDIQERYGRIDVLVNNAAIHFFAPIEETPPDVFHRLINVNLVGTYLGMRAVIPAMKKQRTGSIINISSVDGLRGTCGSAAYNASKWGVRGMTKAVALEGGPFGIRANSIHPGAINTPMLNPSGGPLDAVNARFPGVALSRVGEPSEIAQASLFLASDDASYVSGAELAVDGGWTCGLYVREKPAP